VHTVHLRHNQHLRSAQPLASSIRVHVSFLECTLAHDTSITWTEVHAELQDDKEAQHIVDNASTRLLQALRRTVPKRTASSKLLTKCGSCCATTSQLAPDALMVALSQLMACMQYKTKTMN
jgi:hypothetical protein